MYKTAGPIEPKMGTLATPFYDNFMRWVHLIKHGINPPCHGPFNPNLMLNVNRRRREEYQIDIAKKKGGGGGWQNTIVSALNPYSVHCKKKQKVWVAESSLRVKSILWILAKKREIGVPGWVVNASNRYSVYCKKREIGVPGWVVNGLTRQINTRYTAKKEGDWDAWLLTRQIHTRNTGKNEGDWGAWLSS